MDFIEIYDNSLTKKQCDNIIELFGIILMHIWTLTNLEEIMMAVNIRF